MHSALTNSAARVRGVHLHPEPTGRYVRKHVFDEMEGRNVVMVTGLTQNGLRSEALDVFRRMKAAGFSVDLWRPCSLRKGEADPCLHNQNYV
jgi:pentatricopeptide repeat protein